MSKTSYETPVAEVVVVKIESGLLTNTNVQGTRNSYGPAQTDSWD
jgi:hypothetical protein